MKTMASASKPRSLWPAARSRPIAARSGALLDRSVAEHALVDLDDVGVELLGLDDVAREYFGARLIADFERVAKAARRHQQRPLAFALQQRVGRDGRAHLHHADGAGGDRRARREAEMVADRLHGGVAIGGVFRQEFARVQPPSRVAADDVGERAAAIDPEIPPRLVETRRLLAALCSTALVTILFPACARTSFGMTSGRGL